MIFTKNSEIGKVNLALVIFTLMIVTISLAATYLILSHQNLLPKPPSLYKLYARSVPGTIVTGLTINPDLQNVQQAGIYYNLLGQISRIQYRDGIYTIDLVTKDGHSVVMDLKVNESLVSYVTEKDLINNTTNSISLSELKNGDAIEVQLNGNLKTDKYTVTTLTRTNN